MSQYQSVRWPVDATPFRNEIADSWLIRLFWQMGIDPTRWRLEHRLPNFETPWHHPLSRFNPAQIEALAGRTGLSADQIAALALDHDSAPPQAGSAMPDLVRDPDLVMAVAPRFLRLREGNTAFALSECRAKFATMRGRRVNFCPHCLAEDQTPYLRRHWRLAFGSTCLRHGTVLADRCSHCDAPCRPWWLSLRQTILQDRRPVIVQCWSCSADLRTTWVERASAVVQQLEQRIWLTWYKAAIDRANAHELAEWTPEYAQVMVDRVMDSRRSHPLAGVALNAMTPLQRHHIYAARAVSMASYTYYHFQHQWVASAAYVQAPLLVVQRTPGLTRSRHARALDDAGNLLLTAKPGRIKIKRRANHLKKLRVFSRDRGLQDLLEELMVGLKPRSSQPRNRNSSLRKEVTVQD